jgi:DNA-binding response OmpR family regulator
VLSTPFTPPSPATLGSPPSQWRDITTQPVNGHNGSGNDIINRYGFSEPSEHAEQIMRRKPLRPQTRRTVSCGSLQVDPSVRQVRVDGRLINMTRKEFDLLHLLASQPETVFTRKQIMARVWGTELTRFSRTIDTHVSSVRKKLGANTWIITVRGVGFRLGGG